MHMKSPLPASMRQLAFRVFIWVEQSFFSGGSELHPPCVAISTSSMGHGWPISDSSWAKMQLSPLRHVPSGKNLHIVRFTPSIAGSLHSDPGMHMRVPSPASMRQEALRVLLWMEQRIRSEPSSLQPPPPPLPAFVPFPLGTGASSMSYGWPISDSSWANTQFT